MEYRYQSVANQGWHWLQWDLEGCDTQPDVNITSFWVCQDCAKFEMGQGRLQMLKIAVLSRFLQSGVEFVPKGFCDLDRIWISLSKCGKSRAALVVAGPGGRPQLMANLHTVKRNYGA